MELKIKKIGVAKGTIGWLAKGLESGTLTIIEGTMKNSEHHGLWLKGPDGLSQFLGGFNQYNLDPQDGNFQKYDKAEEYSDRHGLWTDAAWKSLMQIAETWCDECNQLIEDEEPIEIKIIRVEKENTEAA